MEYQPGKFRYGFLFAQLKESELTELTAHQPGGLLDGALQDELVHLLVKAPDHHRGAHVPGLEGQPSRAGLLHMIFQI